MPRIVGERALERLGYAYVFRSMSESRPGMFHLTVLLDNGGVRCSCEGFCMHGHCWHIDKIPLCLKQGPKADDTTYAGQHQQCFYVDGHKGDHSWGPEQAETESQPEDPSSSVEQFDPLKGLPQ